MDKEKESGKETICIIVSIAVVQITFWMGGRWITTKICSMGNPQSFAIVYCWNDMLMNTSSLLKSSNCHDDPKTP